MAVRTATRTIITHRDKQRVTIWPKESFDFTDAELAELEPAGAVQKPVVEPAPKSARRPRGAADASGL